MLIIRDQPDYYDSAIGYGIDKTIVYRRHQRVVTDPALKKDMADAISVIEDKTPFLRRSLFDTFYVGFCGRLYVGTYVYQNLKTGRYERPLRGQDEKRHYQRLHFWSERDYPPAELDRLGTQRFYLGGGNRPSCKTLREWLGKTTQGVEHQEIFQKHRLVSFVVIDREFILDPCLKDLSFQRVIGGVEAYQEISMFISGVLGSLEKDIIVTDDRDLAISKGFDDRSFRKEPTKRKF